MLAKRSVWEDLAIAASLVAASTALRWALANMIPNLTFVTYYPAVLFVTLAAGWRWGTAAAVVSGIVGTRLFGDVGFTGPTFAAMAGLCAFLFSALIIVATAHTLRRSLTELEEATRHAEFLNHELQHRVGNTLAVVQAIASQTLRHSGPEEFTAVFGGRLRNLAKANDLLGRGGANRCSLRALVVEACKPFCDNGSLTISGPECHLPSPSCVPLMMCLHELCTNAVKHGSLAVHNGHITVTWLVDDHGHALINWLEEGGPHVTAPARKGMGTGLLRAQAGIADVRLNFAPGGVQCTLVIEGAEEE
jgi:two-component sensor histidine kinase